MILKNISYEPVEAVCVDTKTVVTFLPGIEKEVDEVTGKVFLERYAKSITGSAILVEVDKITEPEKIETEEEATEYNCEICGRTFESAQALRGHKIHHK